MQIEQATERDADTIAALISEIETYYGGEETPVEPDHIRAWLFSDRPVATVLLARDNGQILGMASYSFLWPAAGADASLFLKELFVRENARRRGVATALMARVREAAAQAGCSRVEWTADADNPAALAFYQALGAQPHHSKTFYRIEQANGRR
ncbi:GNAT family N-acetyltransferase [Streptomyces orinoci]|uniref:GNAT family N-acetyltransferase n=1 Tax=Streptomyces orinoci TaxID=67339 RepID=A0ABV3K0X2_STRON|nr:GNAT family N-acetyltransferase [Streptomyces orinoci]